MTGAQPQNSNALRAPPSQQHRSALEGKPRRKLYGEGTAAAARGLHIRVFKLEARTLQRLHIVDFGTLQVHERSLIDKHLEAVELECLIDRIRLTLEVHLIREPRAASAHHRNTKPEWRRTLLSHDLLHLLGGKGCKFQTCGHYPLLFSGVTCMICELLISRFQAIKPMNQNQGSSALRAIALRRPMVRPYGAESSGRPGESASFQP